MTLRRDHVVGGVLIALAAAALALSGDLPFGTLGSPGPGMMPMIVIALVAAFSLALLASAHKSPPFSSLTWNELPHAASIVVAGAIATVLYTRLGFLVSMAAMIFALLVLVERVKLLPAAAYALGLTLGVKLLLGTFVRTQLPTGPWGF